MNLLMHHYQNFIIFRVKFEHNIFDYLFNINLDEQFSTICKIAKFDEML